MLRLVWYAFLTIQHQLISNVKGIIHDTSNRRKEQDYEEHHEEDYDIEGDNRVALQNHMNRESISNMVSTESTNSCATFDRLLNHWRNWI